MDFVSLAALGRRGRSVGPVLWPLLAPAPLWAAAALLLWARAGHTGPFGGCAGPDRTVRIGPAAGTVVDLALGAAGAALAVTALARLLQQLWLCPWRFWPLSEVVQWRAGRWAAADEAAAKADGVDEAAFQRHAARRARIALARPRRATWTGDRFAALEARVRAEYGLDFASAWPRLWLVLPDEAQSALAAAARSWLAAAAWAGWGLLTTALAQLWPPAALGGIVLFAWSLGRARTATAAFTDLAEASVDLYTGALAAALGLPVAESGITVQQGEAITSRLRKGS